MRYRTFLSIAPVVATALALAACPAPDTEAEPGADDVPAETAPRPDPQPEPTLAPLEVSNDAVRAADGTVLLSIDDVPGNIPVDADTEFGAASNFTEASLSPDDEWLAVATAGAAHSAGWLVHTHARNTRPAAFQYGGSITIGPWSNNGRHVTFVHEGPAGDRTLTVVDRDRLGETVEDSAIPVRAPHHHELSPEERIYEAVVWRDGHLVFQVDGERWVLDPATETVQREG